MALPIAGPIAIPVLKHNPCIPIASPQRLDGIKSATYAAVAVGLNPVEKPCINLKNKKPETVVNMGYKNPQTKQTKEPTAITGTRPILSVNFPLKGLEIPAVKVKRAIINPLYSPPPILLRYAGSSGSSMLKLAEKRKELRQTKANCKV